MKFKEPQMQAQFEARPAKLREVAQFFVEQSQALGIEPVVTRVTDCVPGESGVHPAGRAVDFRDEYAPGRFLYSVKQTAGLIDAINERFPRDDGKLVCIHHSFNGGPFHFHIQIGVDWV